jgi:hypothetical protein
MPRGRQAHVRLLAALGSPASATTNCRCVLHFPIRWGRPLTPAFADLAGCFSLQFVMGVSGMDASGSVSGLVGTSSILAAGTKGWGVVGKKASEFLVVDPVVDDSATVDMVEG